MRLNRYFLAASLLALSCLGANAQKIKEGKTGMTLLAAQAGAAYDAPGNLNPILPGYFADPTIRKFGDTYYIYATTDGTGNGYGPAQVWVSKDFVNWKNVVMNWPTTEVVWAPDVVQQPNGKFRYYYCEPCVVHVGESDSPLGPWHNILGEENAVMVPDRFVHNAITLDPQLFRDDDGQEYLYFGTWGIYTDFGCGVAKLNPNWKEGDGQETFFTDKKLILNTEITDFFEAPFVFKKDGIYYFTYSSGSCHDDTYRVQYATASHPMGPYTYKGAILKTNADGTVHGPGHHSIFVDGDDYYIVYHRHNNPHSLHGFHRQVCIDRLTFDKDGNINPIQPTHEGPKNAKGQLALATPNKKMPQNLAFGAKATASSYYSEQFRPDYATDDNNGTLWRAAHTPWGVKDAKHNPEWLCIDLGKVQTFNQVWTQFENATFFYQYQIETSVDGQNWTPYANRTSNTTAASPMIDEGKATARFIRITVIDTQKNGHFAAIWNVKVYNAKKGSNPKDLLPDTEGMDLAAVEKGYPWLHTPDVSVAERSAMMSSKGVVVDINADHYAAKGACNLTSIENLAGGMFSEDGRGEGEAKIRMEVKAGKYAFYFNGKRPLRSSFALPRSMAYNAPYTIEAWVLNTSVSPLETVVSLSPAHNDLATVELRNGSDRSTGLMNHNGSFESSGLPRAINDGAGKWQHWVVTYDGYMERFYLDGQQVLEKNNFLLVRPQGSIMLGASGDSSNPFSGYIHSLRILSYSLTAEEVGDAFRKPCVTPKDGDVNVQPSLTVKRLSPEHVSLQLTDEKGEELNTGLLRYQFGIEGSELSENPENSKNSKPSKSHSQNPKLNPQNQKTLSFCFPTDLASMVMTIPEDCQKLLVHVLNDEGRILQTLEHTLAPATDKYTVTEQKEARRLSNTLGDHFNDNPIENGMETLAEAEGDFLITCRVSDIDGRLRRSTPAYNEGGLIMSDGQTSIHIGVFPAYDCGNMVTHLSRRGRPQFPNGKGWDYDQWMQLQRIGNTVYARTSRDGIYWVENPGSPVVLRNVGKVKVGLYQTTYNGNKSWVEFDNVKLSVKQYSPIK